ncbi:MAG: arylsulfatase A-like enzyme [Cellvibrionaceae bacterium]|jgi:arylsulfatase A-like enzyme
MKAIFVMFDTLNRHMLPPYGCDWTHAPNFQRLAKRTVTFDNCYVGSMPCMPARRELHTGRYNFLHRSWSPLEPFDNSMPQMLKDHGVYSHLITDHQHYWEDGGATYHNRYSSYEFVRGQEGDAWKGVVDDPFEIPENGRTQGTLDTNPTAGRLWRQDCINRSYMPSSQEHSQTQVFDLGLEFMKTNGQADNWFLQIETFDPHEPYFSHEEYKKLYPHEYDGPRSDWPPYAPVTQSAEEVEHIRLEYAALLSMCDAQLGRILDLMDEQNMWDDTLLIVGTDHGFLLGEHDWWAKNIQPWYNIIAHTPLFIWDPRSQIENERRSSLVQMIDFPATLLDYFDVSLPENMQGKSLRQTIIDDSPVREAALFGSHGGHVNVTDGRYVYMRAPADPDNKPLFEYTLMPCHMNHRFPPDELQSIELVPPFSFTQGCSLMKIPAKAGVDAHSFGTLLFDVNADPGQETPLADAEVETMMIDHLTKLMRENDSPADQFERLGL